MPKIYGYQHIIYLIVFIALTASGIWAVLKYCKTQKQKNIVFYAVSGVLLAAIVANRISLAVWKEDVLQLIPDSFCGLTSFLFPLSVICIKNKDHGIFHGLIYIAFLNPILTMFYPDFIGQASSVWFAPTMTGLLHHSISIALSLLLFVTKTFKPSLKKWWCFEFALVSYITFGVFLLQGVGLEKAMYLDKPLVEDTILTWYFVGILFVAFHLAFLFCYDYITKKRFAKSHESQTA